ncbi:MAG: hypothetical protein MUP85_20435 [Candidatus Lokiarchaeota archaeon]|nr:hypothetical protein [Candidatus Lokiarchaeota archaeon]
MVTKFIEYNISLKEIDRRKKAFTTLIISIWFGLIISAFDFIISNILLSVIFLLTFAIFLYISRVLTINSLNYFSQIRFLVNDESIERKTKKSEEIYLFKDITKLSIKRTSKGNIREVGVLLKDGNSIFINGLNDFESFRERLINNCSKSIKIKKINEPIDFDHPFYYLFFGFIVSSISTMFIRLIAGLNSSNLEIIYLTVLFYNLIVSLFIILAKPISRRFGKTTQITDYILGILIYVTDVILYFLIL